jgi:hypothetical protein
METLMQMKCVACRAGEPTVTDAEIAEFHPRSLIGKSWNSMQSRG